VSLSRSRWQVASFPFSFLPRSSRPNLATRALVCSASLACHVPRRNPSSSTRTSVSPSSFFGRSPAELTSAPTRTSTLTLTCDVPVMLQVTALSENENVRSCQDQTPQVYMPLSVILSKMRIFWIASDPPVSVDSSQLRCDQEREMMSYGIFSLVSDNTLG